MNYIFTQLNRQLWDDLSLQRCKSRPQGTVDATLNFHRCKSPNNGHATSYGKLDIGDLSME